MITHAQLLEAIHYDPETGLFILREPTPRRPAGFVLNKNILLVVRPGATPCRRCTVYVSSEHRSFCAGPLAWFYMTGKWPDHEVDHGDNDGWNQRWNNFRPASRKQNNANRRVFKTNRSGHKGVHYRADIKKFRAMISIDGKNKSLGHFEKFAEAAAVYSEHARRQFGEFALIP